MQTCQVILQEQSIYGVLPKKEELGRIEQKVYQDQVNMLNKNWGKLRGTALEAYLNKHVFPNIIRKTGDLDKRFWTPDVAEYLSTFIDVMETGAPAMIRTANKTLESRIASIESAGPKRDECKLYFMAYKAAEILGNDDLMNRACSLIDGA